VSEAILTDNAFTFVTGFLVQALCLLPLLCIATAVLQAETARAATIDSCSLETIEDVSELQCHMEGIPPKWHIEIHGQELWVDLPHSRVRSMVIPVGVPGSSVLSRVNIRQLEPGRVRLAIRVRGQVDYALAEMPQMLVVRLATSGRKPDLAEPLLRELEHRRRLPETEPVSRSGPNDTTLGAGAIERGEPKLTTAAVSNRPTTTRWSDAMPTANSNANPPPSLDYGASYRPPIVARVQPQVGRAPFRWLGSRESPMVMIDPGHGGFDPGAHSVDGISEKTLALIIAQRLATALQARGVGAELTRNDDTFLSLGQRTRLANHAHADLFVSIHLNSSPNSATSGIETYYLNNTTDRATIRLARIENGTDYGVAGQPNLDYILANLRQDYKAHESASVARMIETEVPASVYATAGTKLRSLGAKRGPFYVLVGAEMPSVLIECGFLSNPQEAQRLLEPDYQQALADGIANAIVRYFSVDSAVGNL
jgi:N-acetylmuramoyl-L-alanine amidase